MRVFFIGTVEFSKRTLEALVGLNCEIVGVATKSKSNFNADHADLTPLCTANDIPYKYVKDINAPHIVSWISDLKPDVIFCFGWSSLIRKELLTLCPLGIVGYHPAEIPMNRGRHPIIWALVLGLKQTASTFFFMKEGADDGDILSQVKVPITDDDDATSLYNKLTIVALEQIGSFLINLEENKYSRLKQDSTKANYWRKRGRNDGKIDFRMTSKGIYNLIRGLTKPYVGAHIEMDSGDVKVWRSRIGENTSKNIEPGKIISHQGREIEVKSGDASVWLVDHEFDELPKINDYI